MAAGSSATILRGQRQARACLNDQSSFYIQQRDSCVWNENDGIGHDKTYPVARLHMLVCFCVAAGMSRAGSAYPRVEARPVRGTTGDLFELLK